MSKPKDGGAAFPRPITDEINRLAENMRLWEHIGKVDRELCDWIRELQGRIRALEESISPCRPQQTDPTVKKNLTVVEKEPKVEPDIKWDRKPEEPRDDTDAGTEELVEAVKSMDDHITEVQSLETGEYTYLNWLTGADVEIMLMAEAAGHLQKITFGDGGFCWRPIKLLKLESELGFLIRKESPPGDGEEK